MVRSYQKGYAAELSLVHELARHGYMAIRAPRSGRIDLPSPDIIAARDGKLIVIECKARKAAFKVGQEQLDELAAWRDRAGATPYIAWKIARRGWRFLHLHDVQANNGNIGKRFAEEKGMPFDIFSVPRDAPQTAL